MRDKRPVDELSIEELERILAFKKRQARMARFRQDGEVRPLEAAPLLEKGMLPAPMVGALPPATPHASTALQLAPPAALVADDGIPRFEEEDPAYAERPYPPAPQGLWLGRLLLLVEIGGFLGLIGLLYLAFQGIQIVNENIAKTNSISATSEAELFAQQIKPSATPLIPLHQVVLPGGHVWSATRPTFNLEEVPAAYRSAFAEQLSAPIAQATPVPIASDPILIEIPKIDLTASVRSGDDWMTLQAAVGHAAYSSRTGERGNMVLVGHNDIFGEVFKRLPELAPGDEISIQARNGIRYTYVVREAYAVEPTDIYVLDQNLGAQTPVTTLITCYPYRVNTQRWVVFAELVNRN